MLGSCEVIAFVATKDPERARAFYEETLGLRLVEDQAFALVFDANGVMLRIAKVRELAAAPHTVLGWHVDDIATVTRQLRSKGVEMERFGNMPQDADGIWTSPDGARIAWFKDPDGNTLSLTQFPEE